MRNASKMLSITPRNPDIELSLHRFKKKSLAWQHIAKKSILRRKIRLDSIYQNIAIIS